MKLSANPFDAQTGELLPVYRDAYLHGDLATASVLAVERYLQRDATAAHATVVRWHQLRATETMPETSWLSKQLRFIKQQPQRLRRRITAFGLASATLASVALAANHGPTPTIPTSGYTLPVAATTPRAATMLVLHGRILNEKGQPLPGATVLQKGTTHGTSTDAAGTYTLYVPAQEQATLQYGYGGYVEQELPATTAAVAGPIVMQPKVLKRQPWLLFKKLFTKS
jgi:anti-sigma factor RsiW